MSNTMLDRETLREPFFRIAIGGEVLPPEQHRKIVEVSYEDEVDKLDLVRIVVEDDEFWFVNNNLIVKNASIDVFMGHRTKYRKVLSGMITHVEVDFRNNGIPQVVIGAIDSGVKMNWKPASAYTWENRKVSDVIVEVVGMYGYSCEVEDTKEKLTFSRKQNEYDLEFIKRWADYYGFKFYRKSDGEYYFGSRPLNQETIAELHYYSQDSSIIDFKFQYVKREKDASKTESDISDKGEVETANKSDNSSSLTPTPDSSLKYNYAFTKKDGALIVFDRVGGEE